MNKKLFSYVLEQINHYKNLKQMKTNLGSTDKLIRLGIAIILIALYYTGILEGTIGIIALLVALVLTVTSLINFCPLYKIFGCSTAKKKEVN